MSVPDRPITPPTPPTPPPAPPAGEGGAGPTGPPEALRDRAAGAAGDVRGQVAEEAGTLAHRAADEARDVWAEARSTVGGEADDAVHRAGDALAEVGDDLRAMADRSDHPDGMAAGLVHQLGDRSARLAGRMRDGGYQGVVDDATRVARRHPGAFLLAAGAAGFALGRLLRNTDRQALAQAAGEGRGDQQGEGQPLDVGTLPEPSAVGGAW